MAALRAARFARSRRSRRSSRPANCLAGRANEFEQPRAPLSQPGAPVVSLPSTVAPRRRREADGDGPRRAHHRQHGLQRRGSRAALPRPHRPRGPGHRHLRRRTAHHREIRRRRLRALARDRAAAGTDARAAPSCASRSSKAISTGSSGRRCCRSTATSFRTTRPRSPPSARSTSRRSSATCCSPATCPACKFKNSLKASPSNPGAATLVVEVVEKPVDVFARVDNRGTKARGPLQYFSSISLNNLGRMHESLTLELRRRVPDHRAAILDAELPAGAHQRRADAVRQQQLQPQQAGHRDPAAPRIQDPRRPVRSAA